MGARVSYTPKASRDPKPGSPGHPEPPSSFRGRRGVERKIEARPSTATIRVSRAMPELGHPSRTHGVFRISLLKSIFFCTFYTPVHVADTFPKLISKLRNSSS